MTARHDSPRLKDHRGQRCFVLRPFSADYQNVWDLAIKPAIEKVGLDPWDGQEERLGTNVIHKDISGLIWNSRVIVADLTGRNPNVMYELGMAHSAKKPVILVIEESEIPPFDIAHIRYLKYSSKALKELQIQLSERILSTINLGNDEAPDFFPELQALTEDLKREVTYLRSTLVDIEVELAPASADLFFNDQLVGTGSRKISVNPQATRNTVSASTVGFFEHHSAISEDEIAKGRIAITLERVHKPDVEIMSRLSSRVPAWLRDRRKDPHNPVLMRAISSYLILIGERNDAYQEILDLLSVAPGWYMAINQMGFYYGVAGDYENAIPYYKKTAAICDHHYIGNFNLACVYSLKSEFEKCLYHLSQIASNEQAAQSLKDAHTRLSHDPDFQNIIKDPTYGKKFRDIELALFPDAKEIDLQKPELGGYYTF